MAWPRKRTDRLSLPVSPDDIASFFRRVEWTYACLFLKETRDEAVRKLAGIDPTQIAEVAKLQQEIGTLTLVIGDDAESMSLASICHDEILASLQEAEEKQDIA